VKGCFDRMVDAIKPIMLRPSRMTVPEKLHRLDRQAHAMGRTTLHARVRSLPDRRVRPFRRLTASDRQTASSRRTFGR
jgi:hypothetical protein